MVRLFLITFGVLGWAWFELSGGTDFVPGDTGLQVLAAAHVAKPVQATTGNALPRVATPVPEAERVARDAPAADLNSIVQPAVMQRPAQVKTVFARPTPAPEDKLAALGTAASFGAVLPAGDAGAVLPAGDAGNAQPAGDANMAQAAVDYRRVDASRVNLRGGPSTSYDVVTQLLRGEEVEILDDTGDGWVRLRALDGDDIGWMADSFLSASN